MSNVMKEQISAEKDPMGNGFVVDSYDDPLIALEFKVDWYAFNVTLVCVSLPSDAHNTR
jgi:hypothetical protein